MTNAAATAVAVAMAGAALPPTTGRWSPIIRGKNGPRPTVTGWIEVFPAFGGTAWTSIPGVSRFVTVSA